ncbi:Formin-like protein 12 [Gossypium arboreum]|uniref:Formin-like protein 12 n=1 Tax=Gossypium arboreum TaxID=29729 RepID=A0A0B0PHY0_GOSAR|nr:Formin-like protein 12 [Gossypium arboreum]
MKVPRVESKLRVFCFKIQFRTQDLTKKILYLGNTLRSEERVKNWKSR